MHHTRPEVDYTHMFHTHTHSLTHVATYVMCVCVCELQAGNGDCLPRCNKLNDLLNDVHFMQLHKAIGMGRVGGGGNVEGSGRQALCFDCIPL